MNSLPTGLPTATHFIRNMIRDELAEGKHSQGIVTRFPPEPNGYLHVGHAKSIWLNFGLAREFQGVCHLRFDDTNPVAEDVEYVNSIKSDIEWLGFSWGEKLFYASGYFERYFEAALHLIREGKAYVDSLSPEDIRKYRGTLTEPGKESPHRQRSVDENLDLFQRMRAGEFRDGEHILRAKIDMASPNINMRDPALYRIRHAHHHQTGDQWCIYPMYDFAHPLADAYEGITHSICTLEFEDHRPFYDWVIAHCPVPSRPRQIEFSRLNLSYTVMSKRKLLELVKEKLVMGWDDPRLPTLQGMRRRGFPAPALLNFCERVGVTKKESVIDVGTLESCARDHLNEVAARAMCVLRPIKVVIENYSGPGEEVEAPVHPQDPARGMRKIPFARELYIEADDFMENPPKKFFRLTPGSEVRLRYAYIIKCESVVKDSQGNVVELRCSYDPKTRSGSAENVRNVKGVIHWVPAEASLQAEVRLYDRLFSVENPNRGDEWKSFLNPQSLERVENARVEPFFLELLKKKEIFFQFERLGYFSEDMKDSSSQKLVLNRSVTLKDTWAKLNK